MNQSVTGQMIQGKIIEENTWLRTTPNYWAIPGFLAGSGSACSVILLLGKSTLNKVCRRPSTTVTFAVAAPLLESINLSPKCQFADRVILIGYFPSHQKAVSSIEKGTIRYIHPGTPELQHRTWHRDDAWRTCWLEKLLDSREMAKCKKRPTRMFLYRGGFLYLRG